VPVDEVRKSAILAARSLIENDPAYSLRHRPPAAAHHPRRSAGRGNVAGRDGHRLRRVLPALHQAGHRSRTARPEAGAVRSGRLGAALDHRNDLRFNYLGLQTLYDRYFLHIRDRRIELPQVFFMRVAMGLAMNEINREARAIEFYQLLASFDFMSSTPTLFNSATLRPQLSSCYLTTVADELDGIFEAIKENALLAKFAGGLGNDWTPVRALGSAHQGHQRQEPGRRALPQGGQ
jgi:ribonucleoside-diphosphate reductase alpha chain